MDDRPYLLVLAGIIVALMLLVLAWNAAFANEGLPPTPTLAPTMRVCAPNPTPTPTPAGIPMPEPEFELYLPIVVTDRQNFDLFECVKSGLCPLPTPAPTMDPWGGCP